MATEVETRVLPRIPELAARYGAPVTFTLYPAAVGDPDLSIVTLGAPDVQTVQCFPPKNVMVEYEEDGKSVQMRGVEVTVPTGAATASTISFVPALGDRFDIGDGRTYRIVTVDAKHSGEEIAVYTVQGVE